MQTKKKKKERKEIRVKQKQRGKVKCESAAKPPSLLSFLLQCYRAYAKAATTAAAAVHMAATGAAAPLPTSSAHMPAAVAT